MLIRNKSAWISLGAGLIASLFCMYYVYNYDLFGGDAFFLGCILYPIGILCFALVPVDGVLARWGIPIYALAWTVLDWKLADQAWRIKNAGEEGLGVAMAILFFQVIGNAIPFFMKRQRRFRSRLGITLALFYPGVFIYMTILEKMGLL